MITEYKLFDCELLIHVPWNMLWLYGLFFSYMWNVKLQKKLRAYGYRIYRLSVLNLIGLMKLLNISFYGNWNEKWKKLCNGFNAHTMWRFINKVMAESIFQEFSVTRLFRSDIKESLSKFMQTIRFWPNTDTCNPLPSKDLENLKVKYIKSSFTSFCKVTIIQNF